MKWVIHFSLIRHKNDYFVLIYDDFEKRPIKHIIMPKPKGQKNTKNKAKHTKLLNRKINKQKAEKELRKERLKAIINKSKL